MLRKKNEFLQKIHSIPFHLNPLTDWSQCWITGQLFGFLTSTVSFLSHVFFSIIKIRNCLIGYRMYKGSLIFKKKQKWNNSLLPHHIQWNLQSIILLCIIFAQVLFIYCGLYKSDTLQFCLSCCHPVFFILFLQCLQKLCTEGSLHYAKLPQYTKTLAWLFLVQLSQ